MRCRRSSLCITRRCPSQGITGFLMGFRVATANLKLWGFERLGLLSVVGRMIPVTMCDGSCQFRAGFRNKVAVRLVVLRPSAQG